MVYSGEEDNSSGREWLFLPYSKQVIAVVGGGDSIERLNAQIFLPRSRISTIKRGCGDKGCGIIGRRSCCHTPGRRQGV